MSVEEKTKKLVELERKIARDSSLPLIKSNLVFGEGNPNAEVVFIGEAPGFYEDREGRPFVGPAGKLLNKLMADLAWKRSDIYITNIVKRRPPENRDPSIDELSAYAPYLKEQLEIIGPKIIATLGRFSMNYFLPTAKISKDQGKLFGCGNYLVIPLYHPAAALRSGSVLKELEKSFSKLPAVLQKFETIMKDKKQMRPRSTNEQVSLF